MKTMKGVIPALITPFTPDGEVDFGALRRLVRFHLRAGVGGFYSTGASGEWFRLTIDERKAIVATVVEEVNGRVPVAVHVGHFTTAWATDLARHAAAVGADAVSAMMPGHSPSPCASMREIVRYYCTLADIGLPVIAYYVEGAGGQLNPSTFVEEIGAIPGIIGLKYTATDLYAMQNIFHLSGGRLQLWSGHDQMALAGLMMNAIGIIGTNYNYIPEIYVELYRAYCAGDLARARAVQGECNRLLLAVKQFGNLPAYKAVLEMRGLAKDGAREPSLPLDDDLKCRLRAAIAPFAHWLGPLE